MTPNPFLDADRRLRSGWWIGIFFAVLAGLLLPLILLARGSGAGANIFLASILFGLAYLRTRSLAMPFGLHLPANVTQGPILGFGVSGNDGVSLLVPVASGAPDWLYGKLGLEASVPGLVCVVALLVILRGFRRG